MMSSTMLVPVCGILLSRGGQFGVLLDGDNLVVLQ